MSGGLLVNNLAGSLYNAFIILYNEEYKSHADLKIKQELMTKFIFQHTENQDYQEAR